MNKFILIVFLAFLSLIGCGDNGERKISFQSPSEEIRLEVTQAEGKLLYDVFYLNRLVLKNSRLGIIREDADFSRNLRIREVSEEEQVSDQYDLLHGKQEQIIYEANRYVLHLENEDEESLDVIFQLSDDGIAFRYFFPETSSTPKRITEEVTSFNFSDSARGWLQPMSKAKTGWSETNPSYEENYRFAIPLDSVPSPGEGWVYPALVNVDETWVLISETALDRHYSGTRLVHNGEALQVTFPQKEEVFPGGGLLPESELPFYTPWRLIVVGDLEIITESTLGTDLAEPAKFEETDYIDPGFASWSWALLKDESVNYETTKEFINYAAAMDWSFCLIDVNWDTRIGLEKIKELVDYGREKDVKLLVWYNSSGSWNSTPYTPKGRLLTEEARREEFSKLKEAGVAGIKVDFFGGDGQSMIAYYHDMLADAAEHELMINFHGATLPRGWHRTYPNLLTVEAVKGHEFTSFEQENADLAPAHAAMLPFSRNVFDPMDYTPMVLDTIPDIHRRTTPAFELALPVLFLSGIQHIAETPEGMAKQPEFVKEYLRDIPVLWDESRYIQGYPGEDVVIARRKDDVWHIAGINGEEQEKNIRLNLEFIDEDAEGILITEGQGDELFTRKIIEGGAHRDLQITLSPYGGFIIKIIDE